MKLASFVLPFYSFLAHASSSEPLRPSQLSHGFSSSPQETPHLHARFTASDNSLATPRRNSADLHSHKSAGRSLNDWKIEHVLLATIEGELSMLNRHSGQEVWRVAFDGEPMVNVQYHKDKSHEFPLQWIVEPNKEGSIYVVVNSEIQQLAYSIKELADIYSPWEDKDMPFVYTAKKENSMVTFNATNGEIVKVFSASDFTFTSPNSCRKDDCTNSPTITVGRTTYTVSIQHRESGETACLINYSEWTPNVRDKDLYKGYTSSLDNKYVYTQRGGVAYSIEHRPNSKQSALYNSQFKSPVVQVFDVAHSQTADLDDLTLVLLPQPPPPALATELEGKIYVSRTSTGSLFALSETNYPSVTDGAFNAHLPDTIIGVHNLLRGFHVPLPLIDGPQMTANDPSPASHIFASHFPGLLDAPPTMSQISPGSMSKSRWPSLPVLPAFFVIFCVIAGCYPLYFHQINRLGFRSRIESMIKPTSVAETGQTQATAIAASVEQTSVVDAQVTPTARPMKLNDAIEDLNIDSTPLTKVESAQTGAETQQDDDDGQDGQDQDSQKPDESKKKKARRGGRGKGKRGRNKPVRIAGDGSEHSSPELRAQSTSDIPDVFDIVAQITARQEPKMRPDTIMLPDGVTDVSELRCVDGAPDFIYQANQIIGTGMQGTNVYSGWHKGKVVAIKRMLKTQFAVESTEVATLRTADHHQNIINYYGNSSDQDFLYIALEKCQASLDDLFDRGSDTIRLDIAPLAVQIHQDIKGALFQLIDGLTYLHRLRIIHRDIKPQNILIAYPETSKDNKLRLVISDFGLSRTLNEEKSTLATGIVTGAGTTGWKAPEIMKKIFSHSQHSSANPPTSESTTSTGGNHESSAHGVKRAADIFPMACVFYFIITKGYHPYDDPPGPEEGDAWKRHFNILQNRKNYARLEHLGPEAALPLAVIDSMLCEDPHKRPSADEIKKHPYFWRTIDHLSFLCEFSDQIDALLKAKQEGLDLIIERLESKAPQIIADRRGRLDWRSKLDSSVLNELSSRRSYQSDRVEHLLRAFRNKKRHYLEASPEVKALFKDPDEGFLRYWTTRFPGLLMHCYDVAMECGMEDLITRYHRQ
jgi:serine/threonine-protein kinase/endoribonuclease IRE1